MGEEEFHPLHPRIFQKGGGRKHLRKHHPLFNPTNSNIKRTTSKRRRWKKRGKPKIKISFNKCLNNKYSPTNTASSTVTATSMKVKWKTTTKMVGDSITMPQAKNMMAALLMIKSMAMDATTSSKEQSMKEIGAAA